jgi:SecD/SecF fusion protein
MSKKKNWQLFVILAVIALTIYNILPTIFYYSKPLKVPVEENQAEKIVKSIFQRVNSLENDSINWIKSFCSHIQVDPKKIETNQNDSQQIFVSFRSHDDAQKLKSLLPKAASLRPFSPSRLTVLEIDKDPKIVTIQTQIPINFELTDYKNYYEFGQKFDNDGRVTLFYKNLIFDRAAEIVLAVASLNERSLLINQIYENQKENINSEQIFTLADIIVRFNKMFNNNPSILKRFYSNFLKRSDIDAKTTFNSLITILEQEKDKAKIEKINLKEKEVKLSKDNNFLDDVDYQNLQIFTRKELILSDAKTILKKNEALLNNNHKAFSVDSAIKLLNKTFSKTNNFQTINLNGLNPFIESLQIDWKNSKILFSLYSDILNFKENLQSTSKKIELDNLQQLIFNEIAFITRQTDEHFLLLDDKYVIELDKSSKAQSYLCLNLEKVAKNHIKQLVHTLNQIWRPKHPELQKDHFPIVNFENYQNLSPEQKSLCMIILSPVYQKKHAASGMKEDSIYIVAKGLDKILNKYQIYSENEDAQLFIQDFQNLSKIMYQLGFIGYPASQHLYDANHANDYVFEKNKYYQSLLSATREEFYVSASKKTAILELSDIEQRILTQNKIDTHIHEDLLKWNDDYHSAQVSIDNTAKLSIPKPTKNIFWNNLRLSLLKYFRGDERKVLHWGLDLSGGKTVSIELRDQNNKIVKSEEDLKQGLNELYTRVNKMGISEVTLRLEGHKILLDFPGSQNLSAKDLVKASTMFFHVVNEKFSNSNLNLKSAVNQFLQEVWNEAVVMNKKDSEGINEIAFKHLYGDTNEESTAEPRTQAAKILYDNGLRLSPLNSTDATSSYNDTYSKIAIFREENFTKWSGQSHPLLIIFKNYALEGSSLTNIRASYDPSKGNFLSFEVSPSIKQSDNTKVNPRINFHAWTSQFSKESIQGTINDTYSDGKGWKMAVILNGAIISSPTLDSALKDSAMISGSFSQREVNQLVADLKAGSLTFTPKILSEKNVSPELGKQDRKQGILAMAIALIFVFAAMIFYYRFSGLIATIAVLLNLIIMWAVLQNLHAVLSLAGIAGIILTVGMAVDANVLVFERIREEFSITKKLNLAVNAGYKKAFTAILDSNVTTIIAALILLNFDSGPIKGFALTLIIGIASSMFTSLFMTKFFFSKWIENPKHQSLKMMNLIKPTNFDFLKKSKYVISISSIIVLLGLFSIYQSKGSILGMDFTGGYSLNVELVSKGKLDYRKIVEDALQKAGASSQDFSVRELTPENNVRIILSKSLNDTSNLLNTLKNDSNKFKAPQVQWVVQSLKNANIDIDQSSLDNINSSFTSISGQISDSMKYNAVISLLVALIAIMCYIAIRFEWKYSLSAILCLVHDIFVSVSIVAVLYYIGLPIQIDMNTIAALMTIIGYSLNDTIIIFDRIREDLHLLRKNSLKSVVNHALNVTLSRTLMTSITTMLVLLALVGFGGKSIFSFALVMSVGVVFGTLSSLFIASPMMLAFHKFEEKAEKKRLTSKKA